MGTLTLVHTAIRLWAAQCAALRWQRDQVASPSTAESTDKEDVHGLTRCFVLALVEETSVQLCEGRRVVWGHSPQLGTYLHRLHSSTILQLR